MIEIDVVDDNRSYILTGLIWSACFFIAPNSLLTHSFTH